MVFGEFFCHHGQGKELVNLNVGDFKQSVAQRTLLQFPHTHLGKLLSCHLEHKEESQHKDWEQKSNDTSTDSSFEESSLFEKELEKFDHLQFGQLQKKIWIRMENPGSAKLMAVSSLSVVLASILAMCVHSMSEFQKENREMDHPMLEGLAIACIACFTGELAIWLAAVPCQKKYWKKLQ
ncbi:Potassium voltage-gated channel subfamily S member 3 [Fukomys damarensis]|uniref:Potassium voltage-gated channel subfamily S member 3 n=1 Tax=Fukomys damarensis TaxID=885580 RepID=A0A091CQ41_FUKDA|nr:Potassium voltage-gated channel subfamily S member 3 [Fukomys damarensis]